MSLERNFPEEMPKAIGPYSPVTSFQLQSEPQAEN